MAGSSAIEVVPVRFDNFSYIIHHDDGVCIVDPAEATPIATRVDQTNVTAILLTHHHNDHIAGVPELVARYGCPVFGPDDARMPMVTNIVGAGDRVLLSGDVVAAVFDTPGHTATHIGFYVEKYDALFCGDLIFSGGCGRLSEGTGPEMWASIEQFDDLPDETQIYCGHEYTESNLQFALTVEPENSDLLEYAKEVATMRKKGQWTIPCNLGRERRINPFLRVRERAVKVACGLPDEPPGAVFTELRAKKDRFQHS